jgi:tripartite-type tricarboxylate transporter receptor subunit TctC
VATSGNAFNATLYEKLNFNFLRDIAPVAGIMIVPDVMVVHPSVPAKTIPELIAYAKANPGKINIASGTIGGPAHVAAELFKMMTGTDMPLVSYRSGGPALTDLLGGEVQVMFATHALVDRTRQGRQTSRARGHRRDAFGHAAGPPDGC